MRTPKRIVAGVTVLLLAAAGGVVWSGAYDVAADQPHYRPVAALLAMVRKQSVAQRASGIVAPDLAGAQRIADGAREYAEMCAQCHQAPGQEPSELRRGLNPQPPDLSRMKAGDPRHTFWIVKHGIRMTGMPAWGKTHDDATLWNIVAFVQKLPELSAQQYKDMTAGDHHAGANGSAHHAGHAELAPPPRESTAHPERSGK